MVNSAGEVLRSLYSDAVGNDDADMMEFDGLMAQHDDDLASKLLSFDEYELAVVRAVFDSYYDPIDDNVEEAFVKTLRILRGRAGSMAGTMRKTAVGMMSHGRKAPAARIVKTLRASR